MIPSPPLAFDDLRILIFEDNATDATLIAKFLQKSGVQRHNIVTTDVLNNAMEILARRNVDICLTDYDLPAHTGLDLMDEARRNEIDVPFVMLTAVMDPNVDREALARGAYDFIIKSTLTTDSLVRSIRYSLARHKREAELAKAAYHDSLSDLPNRKALLDRLEALINESPSSGPAVGALIYISLNGLKFVNEAYGFKVGDALLREIGRRLRAMTGPHETVGRIGNDEFVCVVSQSAGIGEANITARRLATALAQPVRTFDGEHNVTAAIGVTVFPRAEVRDAGRGPHALPNALDVLQIAAEAATEAKLTCRVTRATEISSSALH